MLSRRSLQKLLDNSSSYLSDSQRHTFAEHLGRKNRDSLEAEWELIVLAALANAGTVRHEPDLGGSSRVDIEFSSAMISFIADVRTVSDEQMHRDNPVDALRTAIRGIEARLRSNGVIGTISFRVGGEDAAPWKGIYKAKLRLPRTHEFKAFIFDHPAFQKFLAEITTNPEAHHNCTIQTPRVSLALVFNPGRGQLQASSHTGYTHPAHRRNNPIFRALEKKSSQLKRAGVRRTGQHSIIFLCDGGSDVLNGRNLRGVSLHQIVTDFLNNSASIDFVVALNVQDKVRGFELETGELVFCVSAWSSRYPHEIDALEQTLAEALGQLPPPIKTVENSVNEIEWSAEHPKELARRYLRASRISQARIQISLRATIHYLAGQLSREDFEYFAGRTALDYLNRLITEGRGIAELKIVPIENHDDDLLEIMLNEHDAGASQVRLKTRT